MSKEQTEIVFETEDKKTEALLALEDRLDDVTDNDLLEIEKIRNAKVTNPSTEPTDDLPLDEDGEAPELPAASEPDVENPPESPKPNQTWFPSDLIPKETYIDKTTGEEKKFWTYDDPITGPERLAKTLVHGQKRIRKLEDEVLPQALKEGEEIGFAKAKAEYEAKIAEMQKVALPQPVNQIVLPQTNHQTESQYSTADDVTKAREKLKSLSNTDSNDYDINGHSKAMQEYMFVNDSYKDGLIAETRKISEDKFKSFEETQKTERQKAQELEAKRQQQEQDKLQQEANYKAFKEVSKEIDGYATKPDNTYLAADQSFESMTNDAKLFHVKLAQTATGKVSVNESDIAMAESAYQRKDAVLLQKMTNDGLMAPKNYEKWDRLNKIDAVRTGWIVDPYTGKWEQKKDVRFPDMESADLYLQKITGESAEKLRKAKVDAARQITNAINRRDTGVVQMDPSRGSGESEAGMTEEQAVSILQSIDVNDMVYEVRQGKMDTVDKFNKAKMRLGMDIFDPNDIER